MKNLNKVLAMLVVFMMVVSTVAFASFTDVAKDSTYNVAIKVGTDLGLFTGYEDGSFKPEGEITRAEFAAIVVRMKGQDAQAEGAKSATMFTDVPADHWAAGYINIAVRLGIINGYGDGNFGPSDLVEYQDAITMIVRALGYEPAIGAAGYPTGYLTKAGDLGLTANVSGVNGVAINRGKVAQIVFNALDVPLMTQSGYGTFTQYVVNDGYSSSNGTVNVKKTILSENHNIVKLQGIVESTTATTATTTTATEKVAFDVTNALYNKFGIGDRNMEVGSSDAAAYVGKKVIAFVHYNEFEDVATIVSIYDAPVADSLVVALADLETVPGLYAGEWTYYNENGRLASVKLGYTYIDDNDTKDEEDDVKVSVANVYINGVSWTQIDNIADYANLKGMSGTVEFVLLDSTYTTSDYDTVYITAAKPFVVDEVKTGTATVKAKNKIGMTNRVEYNEEDGDIEATLYGTDGAEMDWADLEENDVLMLSYLETTSGKKIYVAEVADNTVEGKVDGLSGKGVTREVTIGGVAYKVVVGAESDKEIKAGDEGIFYLDANDNIVYFDVTASVSKNYGYVIATAAPKEGDFLNGYQMQILTKENSVVVFDLYKKIKFNNKSGLEVVDKKELDNELAYSEIAALKGEVITYNVNSANEITALFTAVKGDAMEQKDLDVNFTYNSKVADLTEYDAEDMTFAKGWSIDEDTVIFLKKEKNGKLNESEVVALPALEDGDALKGVTAYNVSEEGYISCILIEGATSIGNNTENATFILKISQTIDEDGNDVYVVTGYKDLEVVTYELDTKPSSAIIGTLVVPEVSVTGKVTGFKAYNKGFGVDSDKYLTKLSLTKIDGNKLYVSGKEDPIKVRANTNVYVFDANKAESARGFYQIDADGYLDYEAGFGIYYGTKAGEKNLDVDVYVFSVDGDAADGKIVDIVYYINLPAEEE